MRPPQQGSPPRPSSVCSSQSLQSNSSTKQAKKKKKRGGLASQEICVGEELKLAVATAIERFRLSEEQHSLEFPSSLTSTERAYIHRYAQDLGLKSKSRGKGANRYLTVSKKEGIEQMDTAAFLSLTRNSRHHMNILAQKCPLNNKERQDLIPRADRSQYSDGFSKEFVRASAGRLNNGVPQVPGPKIPTDLDNFRKTLPVYKYKDDIIRAINNNRVVMISGETGSGKTTQVPQMILDESHETGKPCRIFCTQPRRISAQSVAERVAQERAEKIGHTVGYQIRLESRTSPKTLLTFCTNGVLLRTLMGGESSLSTVTHVLVDEVHERDRYGDFLLVALRELLNKHRTLKVILMSATLNVELFTTYFGECPLISVPGNLFNVEEFFLEDCLKLTSYTNKKMEDFSKAQAKKEKQQETIETWCKTAGIPEHPPATPENQEAEQGGGAEGGKGKSSTADDEGIGAEDDVLLDEEEDVFDDNEEDEEEDQIQVGEEKEELDPEVCAEMDQLLGRIWLEGVEEPFHQIYYLIAHENVSVNYQHSETSLTPLMAAAGRGFKQQVEILLHLGANTSLRACNDWAALDWARAFERSAICNLLESHMAVSDEAQEEEAPEDQAISLERAESTFGLSEEDAQLLEAYHHSWDDSKVDHVLILTLLHSIHSGKRDGAILVFLSGYDDIVTLRDRILEDKRFSDSNRYIIYTLHSLMQSSDQRRVFKTPASGVRKIILATNIAETSITINDVVFVIDAGKVKEKSYDALTSVTMLKTHWIAKAAAQQRMGRAGRCQEGVCYHLFSRARFDAMPNYALPEILRYPLQSLCLDTKLLAPNNTSIADFLAKAPDPPAFLIIRNAVHVLKQMDALDPFEDLTELGHHLADLPVEPKYGKMILYGIVLKCLDPVLTIASTMAYKDPFILPLSPFLRREAQKVRRSFADKTCSDHMCVLRAFQAWQKAKMEGMERSFCEKNFISAPTMEMIMCMRSSFLGQLRASGFVRARGGGDIRDLNTNSENWAVVKAALCAGSYPNIVRADKTAGRLVSPKLNKVSIHPSSVLCAAPGQVISSRREVRQLVQNLPTDWVIYEEMTRTHLVSQVKNCTIVSPVTVALFAGPAKMPVESVKSVEEYALSQDMDADIGGSVAGGGGGGADLTYDNGSESEEEEAEEAGGLRIVYPVDEWINFRSDVESANKVLLLRQKWHSLFLRRMRVPSKTLSQTDEQIIRAVVSVLTNEEQALGLQQPAGIGQRPRPMSADTPFTSGGSRHNSMDESEDDGDKSQQATPKARPFKIFQNSPKRREFLRFPRGDERSDSASVRFNNSGPNSARGSTSSTPCLSPKPGSIAFLSYLSVSSLEKFPRGDERSDSASGRSNNSGPNSARGSTSSTPCHSPQPGSAAAAGRQQGNESPTKQARYFIMKSLNHKSLDISMQKEQWATHPINEKKLNRAFQEGHDVYLIFSVQGSGHFQGIGKMTSQSGAERGREFGSGFAFGVEWIKRANLPFNQCHHLQNAWNENKRVQVSRDGQELEPSVGAQLVQLWERLPHHVPRMMLKEERSPRHGSSGDGLHDNKSRDEGRQQDYSQRGPFPGQARWSSGHQAVGPYTGYGRASPYAHPMAAYGPAMYMQAHPIMGQGQMLGPAMYGGGRPGGGGHVPVTILQRSSSSDAHGSSRSGSSNGH